jgi:hypothetical protein
MHSLWAAKVESRMGAVAWAMRQRSVSYPRSSNRTCGFPTFGSPTGFSVRHTKQITDRNVIARRELSFLIQVQRSRIVTLKPARAWCSRAPLDGAAGTEQTACDRPAGATDIRRSDWEPWVHSQGSLLFSGERPVTAAATVDGTRRGAVVESSVELTPSPHGSLSSPLPRSCVSSCRAVVWLDQFLRA